MANIDNKFIKNLVSDTLNDSIKVVLNDNKYGKLKNLESSVKSAADSLKVQILNTITSYNNGLVTEFKNEIYSYLDSILQDIGSELKSKNAINIIDDKNHSDSLYKKITNNIKNEIDVKLVSEIKKITDETLVYYYSIIYNRDHIMDTVKLLQNFYNTMVDYLKEKFDYDLCDLNNNINFDSSGITSFVNKDQYIAFIKNKLKNINLNNVINSDIKKHKENIYNDIHNKTDNYKKNIKSSIEGIFNYKLLEDYYYEIIERSIKIIYQNVNIINITENIDTYRVNCITTVKTNKYVNDKIRELYDEVYEYIITLLNTGNEYH